MVLFPNAKINLGLNITAKRPDGYHNIETIFLPVPLCDVMEFIESGASRITITGINLGEDPIQNLVVKAWGLMSKQYHIPPVEIHLHKIIPVGAGLGGGSSNAAFMLKGLNDYFQCGASISDLEKLASTIGSDCAFFIRNISAFGMGRGEILEQVEVNFDNYQVLLVNPSIHISTKDAFMGVKPAFPLKSLKELFRYNIKDWQGLIINDFEQSVFTKYPEIGWIKSNLIKEGAIYSSMSGSGSTVFGIFENTVNLAKLKGHYRDFFCWNGKIGLC
jgi:4-diphosphocytidyl-2-C-methyl-D-erythritol kinase